MKTEKKKIDTTPLSFFRFINVAIIIFLHYGIKNSLFLTSYARAGSIIVFFYMLSGFVLFLSYHRRGGIELRQYFIKRTMNILPFYYLAFFIFSAILLYMDNFSYVGFFISLFCVQSWVPHYQHYINPPSWFVSGLLFFYCIFPILFYWITKNSPSPKKILTSSMVLWIFTVFILNNLFNPEAHSGYFSEYSAFINSFPLANFCSFYMGVCGAYYLVEGKRTGYKENSLKSLLSTILVLIIFSMTLIIHYNKYIGDFMKSNFPYEASLYSPIVLLMILNLSKEKNLLTRIFSIKIFVLLGAITYPLYILQAPVYHIYVKFISKPMEMSHIQEFVLFLIPFIVIAGVLTFLENRSIKRVYQKYLNSDSDSRPSRHSLLGQSGRLQRSKTGE